MTDQVTNWLAGNYTVGATAQNCYFPVPYYPVPSVPQVTPLVVSVPTPLTMADLEQIRAIVREEVHKALHPEEAKPSATVEYTRDGQTWRGTVYLVEEEEDSYE